jgi:hypothetical protein
MLPQTATYILQGLVICPFAIAYAFAPKLHLPQSWLIVAFGVGAAFLLGPMMMAKLHKTQHLIVVLLFKRSILAQRYIDATAPNLTGPTIIYLGQYAAFSETRVQLEANSESPDEVRSRVETPRIFYDYAA